MHQSPAGPQPPLIPNIVHFAEAFVSAHGAGYPDGKAASVAAEANVRQMYARAGRTISERELVWIGCEVVMAFNRDAIAREERQRGADFLADTQAGARTLRDLPEWEQREFAAEREWGCV